MIPDQELNWYMNSKYAIYMYMYLVTASNKFVSMLFMVSMFINQVSICVLLCEVCPPSDIHNGDTGNMDHTKNAIIYKNVV